MVVVETNRPTLNQIMDFMYKFLTRSAVCASILSLPFYQTIQASSIWNQWARGQAGEG
jgi:hypothetical protein